MSLSKENQKSSAQEVCEVDIQEYISSQEVIKKRELVTLFHDEFYTAVVSRAGSSQAVRVFELKLKSDAMEKFNNLEWKLQDLDDAAGDEGLLLTRDWLQQFCDTLKQHPGWTSAHIAAKLKMSDYFKSPHVLLRTINAVDEETGMTPIQVAIEQEDLSCINEMKARKAKVDAADEALIGYLTTKDKSYIKKVNASGETALHEACLNNQPWKLKLLLKWKLDPSQSESYRYPIHCAMESSSTQCMKELCLSSTDQVKLKDGKYGGTPLHWAVSKTCIYELCNFKADVNAKNNDGETPLHVMVRLKRLECVSGLLANGADISRAGQNGDSALHMAIEVDDWHIARLLIMYEADVNALNDNHFSPLHKAATSTGKNRKRILDLLLDRPGVKRCESTVTGCVEECKAITPEDDENLRGVVEHSPMDILVGSSGGNADWSSKLSGIATEVGSYISSKVPAMPFRTDTAMRRQPEKCTAGPSAPAMSIASDQQPSTGNAGYRVLCLDGGGIRGLVEIQILNAIEKETGRPIRECFDWICGTSTGGILALSLVNGKTLKYCEQFYMKFKDEVFQGGAPYMSENLEKKLKGEFGEKMMSQCGGPRIFVTGVKADRLPAELHLFRSYEIPEEMERKKNPQKPNEIPIWKAARTTAAAPTYFEAFERFLDGGLMANNPTLDMLTEIQQYDEASGKSGIQSVSVVVSLGTGRMPVKKAEAHKGHIPTWSDVWSIFNTMQSGKDLIDLFVNQATQTDGQEVERARAWCRMMDVPYYRFSPQLKKPVELDCREDKTLIKMMEHTKSYAEEKSEDLKVLAGLLQR